MTIMLLNLMVKLCNSFKMMDKRKKFDLQRMVIFITEFIFKKIQSS